MDKSTLIKDLEDEISKIEIDRHNEFTKDWSKGFLKGSLFILEKIRNMEE